MSDCDIKAISHPIPQEKTALSEVQLQRLLELLPPEDHFRLLTISRTSVAEILAEVYLSLGQRQKKAVFGNRLVVDLPQSPPAELAIAARHLWHATSSVVAAVQVLLGSCIGRPMRWWRRRKGETPNVANNRIVADREAGCCNSG